jgi:hypothetical protein
MKPITRIKNIRQLKIEQQQLVQRQAELEKAIRYDWRDLKNSIRPKNVAGQVLSNLFVGTEKKKENAVVADSVSQLAARFTRKLVERAEGKFDHWLTK